MVTRRNAPPAPALPPPPVEPDREQRLLELQQTLAQTQRTLAEALLALSSGQALGVQPLARLAVDGTPFIHGGPLKIEDGKLYLLDGGVRYYLEDLAGEDKTISLEFRLSKAVITSRQDDFVPKLNKLKDFLERRAATLTTFEATCKGRNPPKKTADPRRSSAAPPATPRSLPKPDPADQP